MSCHLVWLACVLLFAGCGGGGGGSRSEDSRFDSGTGFNSTVLNLATATDGSGDIYEGGDFTTYRGLTAKRIIRLDSTGAPN